LAVSARPITSATSRASMPFSWAISIVALRTPSISLP
jgi:hypothetical protein